MSAASHARSELPRGSEPGTWARALPSCPGRWEWRGRGSAGDAAGVLVVVWGPGHVLLYGDERGQSQRVQDLPLLDREWRWGALAGMGEGRVRAPAADRE